MKCTFSCTKSKNLIQNDSCVLCADGLMVESKNYNPEILQEFKTVIHKLNMILMLILVQMCWIWTKIIGIILDDVLHDYSKFHNEIYDDNWLY